MFPTNINEKLQFFIMVEVPADKINKHYIQIHFSLS